ncbi:Lactonase, 7-bladed beta-propeller, partial [Teratosphaeria destructans]
MLPSLTLLALAAQAVTATNLFVSDYAGHITSLSLTAPHGTYALRQTSVTAGCHANPTWLTLDAPRGLLYCLNEGVDTADGSLSSFTVHSDGRLTHVQTDSTISGPGQRRP